MVIDELTAGIDWITATLPGDDANSALLWLKGNNLIKGLVGEGYDMKSRSMLGYQGFSCGNCFAGVRDDGVILQMTSHHADAAYPYIMEAKPNISRIDVQVTVKYATMPQDVAVNAYKEGVKRAKKDPPHRRRKLHIIRGSDGGDTCYVGSASANERSRIYNKEVQSEDPLYTRSWRFEITFKNDAADRVVDLLGPVNYGFRDRCAAIVRSWHLKRGIILNWGDEREVIYMPPSKTLPSDVERQLQWLERQVKPTILRLRAQGFGDRIATLLEFFPLRQHSRLRRRGRGSRPLRPHPRGREY